MFQRRCFKDVDHYGAKSAEHRPRLGYFSAVSILFQISVTTSSQSESLNMLYLVGLGLADERDITVKGLEVVKKAERVYLEAYTAILLVDVSVLVRECE